MPHDPANATEAARTAIQEGWTVMVYAIDLEVALYHARAHPWAGAVIEVIEAEGWRLEHTSGDQHRLVAVFRRR
jgi:hypothetical protein